LKKAPIPSNETLRQARLDRLGLLDTLPQPAFDHITELASQICSTPIALITLVDHDRQWFKSRVGLAEEQAGREESFCGHAILDPKQVLVVEDALQDARFSDNPMVLGGPKIRFYAGAPIVTEDGYALGTVCVIDQRARVLEPAQRAALCSLASLVATLLEHERLQREEAKRNSAEERRRSQIFQVLLQAGSELKSFVDSDYVYQFVNPAYLRYWQRRPEDIVGRRVVDLAGEAVFQEMIKPRIDRALAGEAVQYETAFSFPGLGVRQVDVSYLPARGDAGEVMGVVVRVQDIERRKQREDDLRQALASLQHKTLEQERFIHIISHDLREPINTINNFAGLLAGEPGLADLPGASRYLDFVVQGGRRMASLLNDLLNLIQLDRSVVARQPVDLNLLAGQVRDDLAMALQQSNGQLLIGDLPTVSGDPSLLRIALQNLVSNALKFSRPGMPPVVTVSAQAIGNAWCIEVSDNGIGIPADQLAGVFDMFKRLHSRKQYDGTGLGLSICQRIIELHQGRISVSSELGVGSCFTLVLPQSAS
jgi:signal transduction histidine kinase